MYPKCRICGSRNWRLVGTIQNGKSGLFLYQDKSGHVFLRNTEIEDTKNPLEVVE